MTSIVFAIMVWVIYDLVHKKFESKFLSIILTAGIILLLLPVYGFMASVIDGLNLLS